MAVKYHGKAGYVYLSPSAGAAGVGVGGIRGFTLDASTDTVEVTEFGQTNKTFVIGFPAFQGTLDGFWATDDSAVKTASQSASGCDIYLYPTTAAMTRYIGGPAFIDMSIRTAVDSAVGLAANFRARGSWTNAL